MMLLVCCSQPVERLRQPKSGAGETQQQARRGEGRAGMKRRGLPLRIAAHTGGGSGMVPLSIDSTMSSTTRYLPSSPLLPLYCTSNLCTCLQIISRLVFNVDPATITPLPGSSGPYLGRSQCLKQEQRPLPGTLLGTDRRYIVPTSCWAGWAPACCDARVQPW